MTMKNENWERRKGVIRRALLLVAFSLFVSVNLFSQVTVKVKNVSIKTALKEIEKSSNYKFFFSEDMKSLNNVVSLNVTNQSIDVVMKKLLNNSGKKKKKKNG